MRGNRLIHSLLDMFLFAIISLWDIVESVIFVSGVIICIMLPVSWPMKFVYMAAWLVIAYIISKLINKLDDYRRKKERKKH
jgi:putative flippase GtrA